MLIIGDTGTLIITLAMAFTLLIKWNQLDYALRAGLALMTGANTGFFAFGDAYVSHVELVFVTGIAFILASIWRHHGPQEKSSKKGSTKAKQAKDTASVDGYRIGG